MNDLKYRLLRHLRRAAAAASVSRVYPAADAAPKQIGLFTAALLDRLRADPDVLSAGAGNMVPFSESTFVTAFNLPAGSGEGKPSRVRAWSYQVTPGYAEALGLHLRAGRFFEAADDPAVTVSGPRERGVRHRYLPDANPIGRTFTGPYRATQPSEIVGLVGNVLKDGADKTVVPAIYTVARANMPLAYEVDLVLRTAGDPARAAGTVRRLARALDPTVVVGTTRPLADRLRASFDQPRFSTAVIAAFATVALVLSALGLFGVLSYTVTQRRRELSVRAALGAERRDLFSLVLREGLAVTAGGLVGGMLAAAALAQLAKGVLFGIAPVGPIAYWPRRCSFPMRGRVPDSAPRRQRRTCGKCAEATLRCVSFPYLLWLSEAFGRRR